MKKMKAKTLLPLLLALALGIAPVDISLSAAQRCLYNPADCPADLTPLQAHEIVLADQPWRVDLYPSAGRSAFAQGDWPAAIDYLTQAEALDLLDADGLHTLSLVYDNTGDSETAIQRWLTLLDDPQAPIDHLPALYQRLLNDFRVEESLRVLQGWLAREPENAAVWVQLGLLQFTQSHAEALRSLQTAATLDPAYQPLARQVDLVSAQALLSPEAAYQQLTIGRELANQGYPLQAEILIAQAVKADPNYAEAWALLGEMQQLNGHGDGLMALENAMGLNPDSPLVQSLLAVYWQRQGDAAQALDFYRQLAQAEPQSLHWQVELARATADSGDIPAGYAIMQAAVETFSDQTQAWVALADFCATYGMEVSAVGLPAARQALLLEPETPQALTAMGNVLFALTDFDSAQRYYERALDVQPDSPALHYALARVKVQKQQPASARYHLQQALTLLPPNAALVTSIERMLESLPAQ